MKVDVSSGAKTNREDIPNELLIDKSIGDQFEYNGFSYKVTGFSTTDGFFSKINWRFRSKKKCVVRFKDGVIRRKTRYGNYINNCTSVVNLIVL
jgi:hypothetical protein